MFVARLSHTHPRALPLPVLLLALALFAPVLLLSTACGEAPDVVEADDEEPAQRPIVVSSSRTGTSDEAHLTYRDGLRAYAGGQWRKAGMLLSQAFDLGWYSVASDRALSPRPDYDPQLTFRVGYCAQRAKLWDMAAWFYELTAASLDIAGANEISGSTNKWRLLWLDAHYNLGMTYMGLNRFRDQVTRVPEPETDLGPIRELSLDTGDEPRVIRGAIAEFTTVIHAESQYIDALYARGRCYMLTGQNQFAREDFQTYIESANRVRHPYDGRFKDEVMVWLRTAEGEARMGSEDATLSLWLNEGAHEPGWHEE